MQALIAWLKVMCQKSLHQLECTETTKVVGGQHLLPNQVGRSAWVHISGAILLEDQLDADIPERLCRSCCTKEYSNWGLAIPSILPTVLSLHGVTTLRRATPHSNPNKTLTRKDSCLKKTMMVDELSQTRFLLQKFITGILEKWSQEMESAWR